MLRENSDTGLRTQQLQLVRQHDATDGLPSGKEDKKRRLKSFSAFFSINFFHISSSIKRMHSSAFVLLLCSALGAEEFSTPRISNFAIARM